MEKIEAVVSRGQNLSKQQSRWFLNTWKNSMCLCIR